MIRKLLASAFVSVSIFAVGVSAQRTEQSIGRIILAEPFAASYLGVQTVEVTRENFGKYNLREVRGVAVESVVKDSPAAQAGIQKGDVIVSFNGEEVSSVYKLTRLLNETAPDHTAKITVLRGGGSEIELTATLAKRQAMRMTNGIDPDGFSFPGVPEFGRVPMMPNGAQVVPLPPLSPNGNVFIFPRGGAAATRQIGVNATPLTKQLADYFGVSSGEGLLISVVRENSPAAKAGIKAGDIITEADGKAVKTNVDLIRALSDKKEGDVNLTVVRDKNTQTVKVTPEASKDAPLNYQRLGNSDDDMQRFLREVQQKRNQTAPVPPNQK